MQEEQENEKFKRVENIKIKKKDHFIIKYIIFVLILVLLTAGAVYYTTEYKGGQSLSNIVGNIVSQKEASKKASEDSKYVINSYDETYNVNPIKTVYYYDNGEEIYVGEYHDSNVQYVQIDGLKDEKIEKIINDKLKNIAYSFDTEKGNVYEQLVGNFSNIISVDIYYTSKQSKPDEFKNTGLTLDLTTGDEIPFEKIFVSSAPIKSILTQGLNEELAWTFGNEEFGDIDMNKVDTSEFEEKALMLAKNYDRQKGNIKYSISPTRIYIHGLISKNIINDEYERTLTIPLNKCRDEIAIYKRYLTDKDIYEDNSIGMKNIIAFTEPYFEESFDSINYGKIKDNIFLEEVAYYYEKSDNEFTKKFIAKLSDELQNDIEKETLDNEGMICQRIYNISRYLDQDYIAVSISTYKAKCSREYFKEGAFKDFVKMRSSPRADVGINCFSDYLQNDYPNLQIAKSENIDYYLDNQGNVVARSWDEMQIILKGSKEESNTENNIEDKIQNNIEEKQKENISEF